MAERRVARPIVRAEARHPRRHEPQRCGGAARPQLPDEQGAVDGHAHGAPDADVHRGQPDVGTGRRIHQDADVIGFEEGDRMPHEPSFPIRTPRSGIVEEDLHPFGLGRRHEVIPPLAETEHLSPLFPVELDAHAVEQGKGAAFGVLFPIASMAMQHHGRLGQPALEHEGARTQLLRLRLHADAPTAQNGRLGRGQQAGEDRVGSVETQLHAVGIHGPHAALRFDTAQHPASRQGIGRIEHALEAQHHVLRGEGRAIVEQDAGPQPEGIGQAILRYRPPIGQGRHHAEVIVKFQQSLVHLVDDPERL